MMEELKMSDEKNKVFEDEFMEVQSGLISLCIEFVGENQIDNIYVYCSVEGKTSSFNAFFGTNKEIKMISEIECNMSRVMQFLRTGCQDLVKLKEVCVYHEKPVPTEIKMIYDVASGKFDTNYRYDEICSLKTGKGQSEVFMDWVAEMKQKIS